MTETKQNLKIGVLLINLGTPAAPEAKPVGKYLRQFLMDPLVIDVPYLWRWILVNILIVPRRAPVSASQYRKVWTDRGSPLLFHTLDLAERVQRELGEHFVVQPAMRYGAPGIASAVNTLTDQGIRQFIAFPLYPQYSLAATESSITEVRKAMEETKSPELVTFVPPFYANERYLDAVAEVSRAPLAAARADFVLFSFHGLPEKHVKKTDPSGAHCLVKKDCCDRVSEVNRDCYRAQCYATAIALATRLGISADKYKVCFQSRLNGKWIEPYTDEFYRELPGQGVKRIAVLCPSFVADCLETLEEVNIRGNEDFRRHGGEEIVLIPSLNSAEVWVKAVAGMVRAEAS